MAVGFNASGDKAVRAANIPMDTGTTWTICGWAKITSVRASTYQYFAGADNANDPYQLLGYNDSGNFELTWGGTSSGGSVFASNPTVDTWFYFAIIQSGTGANTLKGYFKHASGSWVSVTNGVGQGASSSNVLNLANDGWDEYCNVHMAYVRVWAAALTTNELDSEMASTTPVKASVVMDWPLANNTDTGDDSGNGYDLTFSGTLTSETSPTIGAGAQSITLTLLTNSSTMHAPTVTPGAVAIAPNHLTNTSTVHSPTVTSGATIAPDHLTNTSTIYEPTLTPGAVAIAPALLTNTSTVRAPELLMAACINGVLVASSNARYFENDSGVIALTGFHTWYAMIDGGPSDPPPTFDYGDWLDFQDARGGNCFKLWAHETPEDWPDEVGTTFVPLPWARTGPGNAADGKLKFDLNTFDQDYFDRMRARAILAGNRGYYVIIQLFQGWQADQKGLGSGDPAAYHPFASANNINSIDGNPDDDADILETRDTSFTAVYNLQKSYIDKVIATVAGLDNVLLEVSNEETATATVRSWQHAIVDYILANNAYNHPVGMTWMYPNGNNANDLYSSNADWISYGGNDSSPLASPVVWPDTGASGKVSLWDTDHMGGLVLDGVYAWKAFCRGHNVLFMDSYDGTFGDDWTANATAEKIRDNLGYMQDYAAKIDLENATPQGALSTTGYCLAKLTGVCQFLVYQYDTGAFDLTLTDYSGIFSLEWLRTSDGTVQAGDDVTGGDVVTLTPPWSGDVVAFLELAAQTVAPDLLTNTSTIYEPTVTPGSVALAPDAISSTVIVYEPTITAGSVTIAPDHITSTAAIYEPTLTAGAVTIAPDFITSTSTVYEPVVIAAGAISPDHLTNTSVIYEPTVTPGAVAVAPSLLTNTSTVHEPVITPGVVAVALDHLASASTVYEPTVATSGVQTISLNLLANASIIYSVTVSGGTTGGNSLKVGTISDMVTPVIIPDMVTPSIIPDIFLPGKAQ